MPAIDKSIRLLSILGMVILCFLGGAAAERYNMFPQLTTSFKSGEVLITSRALLDDPPVAQSDIRDAMASAKVIWDKNRAYNGYTAVAIHSAQAAYLLDMDGHIVHRWLIPFSKAWPHPTHIPLPAAPDSHISITQVSVSPNGDLLAMYSTEAATPYGYGLAKYDKDGNVLWTYSQNAHHDFYVDKHNGNIYVLVHYLIDNAPRGMEGMNFPMLDDAVVILSPEGKEIKRIPMLNAFADSAFKQMMFHATPKNQWDHFHTNSIEKLEPEMAAAFPAFKAGNILVSIRNFSAIAVIDPENQKVVWMSYGPWDHQHSAHFLPNGHFLLFDNRYFAYDKLFSRLLEFTADPLHIVWEYDGSPDKPFFTVGWGRVQRLPNGNSLVDDAFECRIFEIAPDGTLVWNYAIHKIAHKNPGYASENLTGHRNNSGEIVDPDMLEPPSSFAGYIDTAVRYASEDLPFLKVQ